MSLTVLCYHSVEDNPRRYGVKPENFEKQVEFISNNYTVLTMTEAFGKFQESNLPDDAVVFTFDDGLETALNAAKILESNNVRRTFYIISGLIGEFHEGQKILEESEIKDLHSRGHEIGSHTVSYPPLTHYRKDQVKNEIVSSKSMLEELLGEKATSFSYPYGDYDEAAIHEVRKAGYQNAVTTEMSSIRGSDDSLDLPRHVVYDWHDVKDIEKMIEGVDMLKQAYWQYPLRNWPRILRKAKEALFNL